MRRKTGESKDRLEFLLEVGCEEIPAGLMEGTLRQIREEAVRLLEDQRLDYADLVSLGTPRRLVLSANLSSQQAAAVSEVLGPAKRIAYDPQGNPTPAALGFARGQKIDPALLRIKATDKGEYVCAVREEPGRPTGELLAELIPRLLGSLSFPRSMRWRAGGTSFVRPIRWICALLDGKTIPFSFAGISSGKKSHGHAILSPSAFTVDSRGEYFKELKRRFVEVDPEVRYGKIKKEVYSLAKKRGGAAPDDEELLRLAVFSTEWPTALWGAFDEEFLSLPAEVILSVLREQQGYFPILRGDKLLPDFILVANGANAPQIIRAGNERVLKARLVDAQFYFRDDQKIKPSDRVESLRGVGFLPGLGSMFDKGERLVALTGELADRIDPAVKADVQRAALLAKADLLTGVVREFPSLQGVMGREYARLSGEKEAAARAIGEHYLPRSPGDRLPETFPGKLLAVADRIDTIVGCYALGMIPTGSEDPYALRRQGVGILRIAIEGADPLFDSNRLDFSLPNLIERAFRLIEKKFGLEFIKEPVRVRTRVEEAFVDWMRSYQRMKSDPPAPDLVEAVLEKGLDDPRGADRRIAVLAKFKGRGEFSPLIVGFKRAARIIPKGFTGEVKPEFFEKPAESALYRRLVEVEGGLKGKLEAGAYEDYLERLVSLKGEIDAFFEEVMVMAEDPGIRENRLALLSKVVALFDGYGNFRRVQEGS